MDKFINIRVAIGIIINQAQEVLIARRREGVEEGGLWEFPGGKLEEGESVYTALCREIKEEVGLIVIEAEPLCQTKHINKNRQFSLYTWNIKKFSGKAQGLEGQMIQWFPISQLSTLAFPVTNYSIIEAIQGSQNNSSLIKG